MNSKTLFTIIIKVVGLFMLPQIFTVASQLLNSLRILNTDHDITGIIYIGFSLAIFVMYILIVRLLIFKTEILVNQIVPAGSFENDFTSFKMHRSTLLTICVIVVGGLILVEEIPNMIQCIYRYKIETDDFSNNSSVGSFQYIVLSGSKILLALFLIYSNRLIVNFIESIRKDNN